MNITVEKTSSSNGVITLIALTNPSGASVTLSTHGAGIARVNVPDRDNALGNVVAEYLPEHTAPIWHYDIVNDDEVCFSLESPGEDGGRREVSYRWTGDNVLEIYFQSRPGNAGVADILGQTYFNLDNITDASADEYLWINSAERPDFSVATQLRDRLAGPGALAHRWRLRDWEEGIMNDAALLASHRSGRQLSIHTSLPTPGVVLPSSHSGIAFSTLASPHQASPGAPQTTFLHFAPLS